LEKLHIKSISMNHTCSRTIILYNIVCLLLLSFPSRGESAPDLQGPGIDKTLTQIKSLEPVTGRPPNNPANLSYIASVLKKCRAEGLERQSAYWEIRQAATESQLAALRLRKEILEMQARGEAVAPEQMARLSQLEAAVTARSLSGEEKKQAEAAWKEIGTTLNSLNLPYSWHVVKLYLLRDLVNRCDRASFYAGENPTVSATNTVNWKLITGENSPLKTALQQSLNAARQWASDYGDCFYGRLEQPLQGTGAETARLLAAKATELTARLADLETKRSKLEQKVLGLLGALNPDGTYADLGIPLRQAVKIGPDGKSNHFLLSGLDFGSPTNADKAGPLCFDFLDFEFYGLPMESRGKVKKATEAKLESARALAISEGYSFKQPLIVNSYFRPSYYRNLNQLPEAERQNPDLLLQDADGKPVGDGKKNTMHNIWHPVIRSLVADNLAAAAKYSLENIPNLMLFEKIAWEGSSLGCHQDVYGYNKEALATFQAKMAAKFGSIESLNKAWLTEHNNFEEIKFPPSPFKTNGFKPDALSYEFQLFRMESWEDFINHCIRAIQVGAPGIAVGTEAPGISGSFVNGTVPSHRLWKASPATYFEDHHNNWIPNSAASRMHYDLCLYAGKQPIETEWIWTYPRLIKPETEDDFRVTGELSFWRKMVWGRKLLQVFAHFGGWGYNNGYYDQRASMLHGLDYGATGAFVREAATSLVVGKRRANDFWPILQDTEVVKPKIGVFVPTTSMLNEYPFEALSKTYPLYERAFVRWDKLLSSRDLDYRHIPEEAILDGDETLAGIKVLVLPCATYFPAGLADKLLAWVKAGGTLVAEGIPGFYDPYGFENPTLMRALFGDALSWRYTGVEGRGTDWSWLLSLAPEHPEVNILATLDGQPTLISAQHGSGLALVSAKPFNLFVDKGETPKLADGYAYGATAEETAVKDLAGSAEEAPRALYRTITNAITMPTAWSRNHSFEMVMRESPDGKRYLFVVNPRLRETVTDDIILDAQYIKVLDLGLGANIAVPQKVDAAPGTTVLSLRLTPGEGTCLEMLSTNTSSDVKR
jgi:hypothetical protein